MKKEHHHYITESYQQRFGEERKPGRFRIWIMSKGQTYSANPNNKYKQKHYHTIFGSLAAENAFSALEGDFKKAADKIDLQEPLEEKDKVAFSMFLALMIMRPREHKENLRSFLQDVIEKWGDDEKEQTSTPADTVIPEGDGGGVSIQELKEGMPHFSDWYNISLLKTAEENAAAIYSMDWRVLHSDDRRYLCSDTPLHMCSPTREKRFGVNATGAQAGLRHKDVQVTFPISSRAAFLGFWSDNPTLGHEAVNEDIVKEINKRTARGANEVFGGIEEDLVSLRNQSDVLGPAKDIKLG